MKIETVKKALSWTWKGALVLCILVSLNVWLVKLAKTGKTPANTAQQAVEAEPQRPPLPPAFALRLKGDTTTGPRVIMKAEYLPDGDIQLSCMYDHGGGIEAFHTLRWSPTSQEAVNGQWTRTEYYRKSGWFGKVETTTSQFAGKAIVAKLPDTDRWKFLLYEPDVNDPSKDVVVSTDEGGGKGALLPVW